MQPSCSTVGDRIARPARFHAWDGPGNGFRMRPDRRGHTAEPFDGIGGIVVEETGSDRGVGAAETRH